MPPANTARIMFSGHLAPEARGTLLRRTTPQYPTTRSFERRGMHYARHNTQCNKNQSKRIKCRGCAGGRIHGVHAPPRASHDGAGASFCAHSAPSTKGRKMCPRRRESRHSMSIASGARRRCSGSLAERHPHASWRMDARRGGRPRARVVALCSGRLAERRPRTSWWTDVGGESDGGRPRACVVALSPPLHRGPTGSTEPPAQLL